jgi:hypothetical protein
VRKIIIGESVACGRGGLLLLQLARDISHGLLLIGLHGRALSGSRDRKRQRCD